MRFVAVKRENCCQTHEVNYNIATRTNLVKFVNLTDRADDIILKNTLTGVLTFILCITVTL